MLLRHENIVLTPIPSARPVFVGPDQAEREVDVRVIDKAVERPFEKSLARKPVVIEGESVQSIFASELDLPFLNFVDS